MDYNIFFCVCKVFDAAKNNKERFLSASLATISPRLCSRSGTPVSRTEHRLRDCDTNRTVPKRAKRNETKETSRSETDECVGAQNLPRIQLSQCCRCGSWFGKSCCLAMTEIRNLSKSENQLWQRLVHHKENRWCFVGLPQLCTARRMRLQCFGLGMWRVQNASCRIQGQWAK